MKNLYTMKVPAEVAVKTEIAKLGSHNFYNTLYKPSEGSKAVETVDVTVEEVKAVEVPKNDSDEVLEVSDYLDINDLTVKELKELLDSKGIEYSAKAKKSELIKLV